eukprot:c14053_g1_i1.p1 GENE.c14053_g1_i1~~c14053_g1_i1.p1  ORF type:complete len:513 (-),score=172.83 c14053_g1_i1:54-1556(-)
MEMKGMKVIKFIVLLFTLLSFVSCNQVQKSTIIKLTREKSNADIIAELRRMTTNNPSSILRGNSQNGDDDDFPSFLEIPTGDKNFNLFQQLEYRGKVSVGGVEYDMLFDTMTSRIWVPSGVCATCCHSQKHLKPPQESEKSRAQFEQFPDGTWFSGISQIGDLVLGDLTVPEFSYNSVLVKGDVHTTFKFKQCVDSIFGLGFSSHWDEPNDMTHHKFTRKELDMMESEKGTQLSFIDRIHINHLVVSPVFSLYLSDENDGSTLEIGQVDKSRIKTLLNPEGILWVNVLGFPDFRWSFSVPQICVSDCHTVNIAAYIASGVPYIALPVEIYKIFRDLRERVQNLCAIRDQLPTLSFQVMGSYDSDLSKRVTATLDLEVDDYILSSETDETCQLAVIPTNLPSIILGTPFLRKFFTAFDIENKRIGFAQSKDSSDTEAKVHQVIEQKVKELLKDKTAEKDLQNENLKEDLAVLQQALTSRMLPPTKIVSDSELLTHHRQFID